MPKLNCLCGETISLRGIPQRGAFDIIPEVVREPLIDTIGAARDHTTSRQDFERQVYRTLSHLRTPGILYLVECPHCGRLAVFARASDTMPAFWFTREQNNVTEIADSLSTLVDRLVQGDLPPGWQNRSPEP